jgi:hypothetical protein
MSGRIVIRNEAVSESGHLCLPVTAAALIVRDQLRGHLNQGLASAYVVQAFGDLADGRAREEAD